jgi:hypothetical protein
MRTRHNRIDRLDGGDLRNRSVEHMSDAQLSAVIMRGLRQRNPELAASAAATDEEMDDVLAAIIASEGDA